MEDRPESGPTPQPVPSKSSSSLHRYGDYGATEDEDDGDLPRHQASLLQ